MPIHFLKLCNVNKKKQLRISKQSICFHKLYKVDSHIDGVMTESGMLCKFDWKAL